MASDLIINTDDLPEDLLKLIGRIAISWGQLENILALTYKRIADVTMEEAISLAREVGGLRTLSDTVRAKFEIRTLDQVAEARFSRLLKRAIDAGVKRHDIMHGQWGKDPQGEVCWYRKGRKLEVRTDALEELRNEIRDVTAEINYLTFPRPTGKASIAVESSAAAWRD